MTESPAIITKQPKRECRLCGYPSTDYVVIAVPLTSRPQDNAVCADCLDELAESVTAERDEAREVAQRLLELGTWLRVQHVYASKHPWLKVPTQ